MSASAYKDHPIRAILTRILEMQGAQEFSDPAVSDNESYAFARDKVFAIIDPALMYLKQKESSPDVWNGNDRHEIAVARSAA